MLKICFSQTSDPKAVFESWCRLHRAKETLTSYLKLSISCKRSKLRYPLSGPIQPHKTVLWLPSLPFSLPRARETFRIFPNCQMLSLSGMVLFQRDTIRQIFYVRLSKLVIQLAAFKSSTFSSLPLSGAFKQKRRHTTISLNLWLIGTMSHSRCSAPWSQVLTICILIKVKSFLLNRRMD